MLSGLTYSQPPNHSWASPRSVTVVFPEPIERRIATTRERFAAVLGGRPRSKILIQASTESEWVACCLEELGHEVIVAGPNFAPMYATQSRRVKTDRPSTGSAPDADTLHRSAFTL